MKNQEPLACAAGVSGPRTAHWGKKEEMMVEVISAMGELCRHLDGKKAASDRR
jgi:hypothetical protein